LDSPEPVLFQYFVTTKKKPPDDVQEINGSNRYCGVIFIYAGYPMPTFFLHDDTLLDDAFDRLDAFHHPANWLIALGVSGIE
jgi:hypothetical protein